MSLLSLQAETDKFSHLDCTVLESLNSHGISIGYLGKLGGWGYQVIVLIQLVGRVLNPIPAIVSLCFLDRSLDCIWERYGVWGH